ncbi:MAG: type III pantothenate kinase, partial [Lawsonibacter sp.]|nr:type III pantothenate kinase [Lawsonibacter sp.]
MLLAIDIGNTNIVIGGIRDDQIVFEARIATDHIKTSDQYGVDIKNVLALFDQKAGDFNDCIISSVVPPVFNSVRTGVFKVIGKQPMVVGPGIKTGLNIQMDTPSQVGSDRIVVAVAALAEYEPPLTLLDMGTATTI